MVTFLQWQHGSGMPIAYRGNQFVVNKCACEICARMTHTSICCTTVKANKASHGEKQAPGQICRWYMTSLKICSNQKSAEHVYRRQQPRRQCWEEERERGLTTANFNLHVYLQMGYALEWQVVLVNGSLNSLPTAASRDDGSARVRVSIGKSGKARELPEATTTAVLPSKWQDFTENGLPYRRGNGDLKRLNPIRKKCMHWTYDPQ